MGTISFDGNPYIYYKDTWYSLGDSVEIKEGDGFWLYTKIRCTYDLASIAVTVRLLVDSHELGKEYTSINCHDEVTTVWAYCTADYSGTAKAELWLGDLNNLMETKSSWIIDFPAEKDTKLKCYDKTTDVNVKVTLEAKLEEKSFPYYDIENGKVKFYMDGAYQGYDYTDSNGKAYLDITPTEAGTYTIKVVFDAAGDYNGCENTCTLTVTEPEKKDTKIKCYDKTTEKDVKVTLEAKLEEATFPYNDIENKYVKFYTATALIGGDYTDANGKVYMDYTPPTAGTFTITTVFTATGDYNGSEGTCTLTVTEPAKKDTKLKCYDKTTDVNVKVTLEAKLEEAAFPYTNVLNGNVKFYMNGAYQGADYTDSSGKAYLDITPTASGTYTIKVVFAAAGDYNGSEGTCALTVNPIPECDNGVIVTVKDVPAEGLRVLLYKKDPLGMWGVAPSKIEEVTAVKPTAVFTGVGGIIPNAEDVLLKVQSKTTLDIMSEKETTAPKTGCASVTMYGYLGCTYRTRITADPAYPAPGKSFKLKATLIINPGERATEDMEVEFFKLVDEVEDSLDTNLTNESGVAVLSHAEPKGTYTYLARYTGAETFAEKRTVTVREPTCPVEISAIEEMCPIFGATQGTIVFTKLDTLRWFRDNRMPKCLVKTYYWLTPVTGRIAKYSRSARFVIRGLTKVSIKAIERRWEWAV